MYVCPQCASPIDLSRLHARRETCPDCGAPLGPDTQHQWIDVARVNNLAEAGFLTDELVGMGIDARIHQLQEFSALSNHWTSLYLIRVPAAKAREAAARIRQHLAEDTDESNNPRSLFHDPDQDESFDVILWRPIALVVLAGVASFILGQRWSDRKDLPIDRRPQPSSLVSALKAIGKPMVTQSAAGQPRHRLSFDRQRDAWLLELDRDGDGQYDKRQVFRNSETAW